LQGQSSGCRVTVACGLLAAIMIYLRAVSLFFIYIPFFALFYRRKIKHAFVLAGVIAICVCPWYYRNYRVAGFLHFSGVGAINLYRYNACLLLAEQNGVSFSEQLSRVDSELSQFSSQQEAANYAAKRGTQTILSHPVRYALMHLKAVKSNFLPASAALIPIFGGKKSRSGTLGILHTEGLVAGVRHHFQGQTWLFWMLLPTIILLLLSYLLVTFGITRKFRTGQLTLFDTMLILSVIYFLIVPGGASHPRFRVPVAPLISIYAGIGWTAIWEMYKKRFSKNSNRSLGSGFRYQGKEENK
jgi:4-amino-4-deoxy-L-arabinose transferase-like glycosyltransferase